MKKNFNFSLSHITGIFGALRLIFKEGNYMDKAIEKTMRANKNWGVRDRSFVSESIYDMVRNWRLIILLAGTGTELTENNLWTILGTWMIVIGEEFPSGDKFQHININKTNAKLDKYSRVRKLRESYPDWLDELCEKELGAQWDKLARVLNTHPRMVLRANLLKTDTKKLQELLDGQRIETQKISWASEALELRYSRNVFRTEEFQQGLFEVQDAASQMVSNFLDVKPGMRVVDACAGAGGKSLHLAALMKNKGRIIALDTKEFKLQELRKRSSRAGVSIIETRTIDTTKVIKRLKDTADRLLLDVPCSGLGVLRRNPDSKWKLDEEEIERVKKVQNDILERFSGITKVGGKMVYATCSILPSEGEEQIKKFISKNKNWILLGEKRYSPEIYNCDGFYMALLERAASL